MKKTTVNSFWLSAKSFLILMMAVFAFSKANAQCAYQAYSAADTLGNQQYTERLGLIFTVNDAVTITHLGVFDHDSDGLNRAITVGIIRNADSVTVAGPIVLLGTSDTLIGTYRYQPITPLILPPGQYTVVAVGYGAGENNGNTNSGDPAVAIDNGNGLLTFDASSYQGIGFGYPEVLFPNPAAFHAGSFIYTPLMPVIQATVNDITLTTNPNFDLIDSTLTCPTDSLNIVGLNLIELLNLTPDSLIKIQAFFTLVNVNFPLSGYYIAGLDEISLPALETASLINPALPGYLDITLSTFFDYNDSDDNDGGECVSNIITFRVILRDTLIPAIACPDDVIVDAEDGVCEAEVVDIFPFGSDNCTNFAITYNITGTTNESGSDDASGTIFNGGESTVEYIITDFNSIPASADTCSFTVFVEDNELPTIVCPNDTIIQLDPLECEIVVDYAEVTATDNCDLDEIILSEGLDSGEEFPIGTTDVTWVATDTSGNESECTFSVTILDYVNPSLGCINRNVSLDEFCTAVVDPFMVLTGHIVGTDTLLGCLDSFYVDIYAPNGTSIGNVVTGDYLKKTLNYTITNPSNNFSCWGTIFVEDKFPPSIACRDLIVSCVQPLTGLPTAIIVDNCPGGEVILLNETTENLTCDPDYLRIITKTWVAKDKYGNYGDSCEQRIYVERTDLNGIDWPENLTGSDALQCGKFAIDADSFPKLSVTGIPTLRGISLYPFNQAVICNGFVTYTDKWTFNTDCKKIMTRTWEVGEWWCNTTNIRTWVQVIEIKDTEAPVIGTLPSLTVTTQTRECSGLVTLPKAAISDNCNTWTVTINTGEGVIYTNGGIVELTAGSHTVTYTVKDACGNQSSREMRVTVLDDTEPIPVCHTETVVSLKDDGTAWLFAESADDGSFDECGDIDLKIRRVTTTCDTFSTNWVDAVGFCCADAGKTIMVALLVTDESNNTNQCMVSVQVQDKRLPVLTCPDNLTVSCTTGYDVNDLAATFDDYSVAGGGCVNSSDVTEVLTGSLDQCRTGILTRTFTLKKNNQVLQTCAQTIRFQPDQPFSEDMIIYPKDSTFINSACTIFDLHPDSLPAGYGRPLVTDDGVCNQVASAYDDDIYNFAGGGACFKVVRHWTVINWCSRDQQGLFWQDSFDQVLVVRNTIAPVITSDTNTKEVCSNRADCTPERIILKASATDLCTPTNELRWTWEITYEDGAVTAGVGNDASGVYPFGTHHIVFEVEDKCGNISRTEYDFISKSCKAPTAYCKQGLSTSLIAMDTDGNGTADAEMSMVTPDFFDNGSYHSCGNGVTLSFSANVNDTLLVLNCDDKNEEVEVELWVTDINGNQDFCVTYILVEDNNNVAICPNNLNDGIINGKIVTKNSIGVKDVTVILESTEQKVTTTDENGAYEFTGVDKNKPYEIKPVKSDGPLNGVSTLDLVIIQRHILGIQKLTDPFLILAADANKDGKVTASDLVQIRKIILGIESNFTANESWRFVWDGQIFADPNNPLSSALITQYDIANLTSDMQVNFNAYKVGDVNGNAVAHITNESSENRSRNELELLYNDQFIKAGQKTKVHFRVSESILLSGYQATLNVKNIVGINVINAHSHNIGNGHITVSNNFDYPMVYDKHANMFEMEIISSKDAFVSELIQLSNDVITSEAYVGEANRIADMRLSKEGGLIVEDFTVAQNIPNPWNNSTVIPVNIPERGEVKLIIKDMLGRVVVRRSMILDNGNNNIELNNDVFTSGSYTYEVSYGGEVKAGKMIVVE